MLLSSLILISQLQMGCSTIMMDGTGHELILIGQHDSTQCTAWLVFIDAMSNKISYLCIFLTHLLLISANYPRKDNKMDKCITKRRQRRKEHQQPNRCDTCQKFWPQLVHIQDETPNCVTTHMHKFCAFGLNCFPSYRTNLQEASVNERIRQHEIIDGCFSFILLSW